MAKRKPNAAKNEDKTAHALALKSLKKAIGSKEGNRGLHLINQIIGTLWFDEGTSEDTQDQMIRAMLATLEGIAPRNELENLLAAQMVGTHAAAMECLRRAMSPGQTFEGRDLNLKHAAKLLGVYTRQLEALDKHRGKGQQKITVEHVNVHAGGQAIVGNVKAGRSSAPAGDPAPAALENNPDPVMTTPDLDKAPRRKTHQRVRSKRGR